MKAKPPWLLGLQWGACLWLPYILWDAAHDFYNSFYSFRYLAEEWPRFCWIPAYLLLLPGWLAAAALLAAGSRRARPALATMILARVAVACAETHFMQATGGGAEFILPLLAPVLPLVMLRVEEPRVVLALVALGRFREALARSGGVVALLLALAVLSMHQSTLDAVWGSPPEYAFRLPAMLAAVAAMITWASRARRKRLSVMA